MGMSDEAGEIQTDLAPHSILHSILTDPDFSRPAEVTLSANEAQRRTQVKNPNFNFDGLDEEGILRMASLSSTLDRLSAKAIELENSGHKKDALVLARKISFLGDPAVSAKNTPVDNVLETTHGDLSMAAAFLGLKRVERAHDWLEFVVRTQGKKPSDFV